MLKKSFLGIILGVGGVAVMVGLFMAWSDLKEPKMALEGYKIKDSQFVDDTTTVEVEVDTEKFTIVK